MSENFDVYDMKKLPFCCLVLTIVANKVTAPATEIEYVKPSATILLSCPNTRKDEVVEWLFKGKTDKQFITVVSNRTINPRLEFKHHFLIVSVDNIQISNFTESVEGIYKCTGTNLPIVEFGRHLMAAPNVTILNTLKNNTITAIENQVLLLSCITSGGLPIGIITWQRRHTILVTNSKNSSWVNYTLTPNRENNGDMYSCVVDHDMLTHSLNQTVKINVLHKPVVTISILPSYEIFEGQHVMLSCLSDSNPPANETVWVKEKEQEIVSLNSTYFIESAKNTNSGFYSCFTSNVVGNGSKQIHIVVQEINRFPAKLPSLVLSAVKIYIIACCSALVVLNAMVVSSFYKSGRLKCKHCTKKVSRPAANRRTSYPETDVDN